MSDIGTCMVAARKKRGKSRTWLSRVSGVPISTIEGYEGNRSSPGIFNLLCMADALGVTLDEYVGREGIKNGPCAFCIYEPSSVFGGKPCATCPATGKKERK